MKGFYSFLLVVLMMFLLRIEDTESKKMTLDEAKKSIKNLRKVCAKKNDTPKDLLDGQHKGEFPPDERLMCYMRCIMTATKTMKNDKVVWDFFVKNARLLLLEEYIPRVEHAVDVCQKEVTATDGCEVAWQLGKCIYETDSEVILKYDYVENNTLAIFSPVNNSLVTDPRNYQRNKKNFQLSGRRNLHYRRRSRRKANAAVCKNSRTKPQCRRV